eukprot:UN04763
MRKLFEESKRFARLKEALQLNCSLKIVSTTKFALAKKFSSECLLFPKSSGKIIALIFVPSKTLLFNRKRGQKSWRNRNRRSLIQNLQSKS